MLAAGQSLEDSSQVGLLGKMQDSQFHLNFREATNISLKEACPQILQICIGKVWQGSSGRQPLEAPFPVK